MMTPLILTALQDYSAVWTPGKNAPNFMSESVSASVSVNVSKSMTLSVGKVFFSFFFSSLSYGTTNIYAALAIVSTIPKARMRWR